VAPSRCGGCASRVGTPGALQSNERRILMEAITSLTAALALLILFAVTSIRFGVDSHEGSSANDHE